uniref:minibinder 8.6 n=1 Tax=Homo sapiens TaxID=9606 RepID=UPI0039BD9398
SLEEEAERVVEELVKEFNLSRTQEIALRRYAEYAARATASEEVIEELLRDVAERLS